MTVRVAPPDVLVALIDRLRGMSAAIDNAGSLPHRRAAAAAKHFEYEIAPLLEELHATELTDAIVEAALVEHHRLSGRKRVAMPLSSGDMLCPPRRAVEISTHPHRSSIYIERIVIPDELAPFFKIHDIRIGNKAQLLQAGAVDGTVFAQSAADPRPITYDAVQVAMDVVMIVEYTGTKELGAEFQATAIGIGADPITNAQSQQRGAITAGEARALLGAWSQIVGASSPQQGAPANYTPTPPTPPVPPVPPVSPFVPAPPSLLRSQVRTQSRLAAAWSRIAGVTRPK